MASRRASMAHPDDEDTSMNVKAFVRIRPLNQREIAEKQSITWEFNDTTMLENTANGQRAYNTDRCFGPTTNNTQIYDIVGRSIVIRAMEGYNGTILSYGEAGSGKSFTLKGVDTDPGIITRSVTDVFQYVEQHPNYDITIKVSYIEIYTEEIHDLLGVQDTASKNLNIVNEDINKGAVIGGLVEEIVRTPKDLHNAIKRAEAVLSSSGGSTYKKSFSHTIFRLTIEVKDQLDKASGSSYLNSDFEHSQRVSYLTLVDVASSSSETQRGPQTDVNKVSTNSVSADLYQVNLHTVTISILA